MEKKLYIFVSTSYDDNFKCYVSTVKIERAYKLALLNLNKRKHKGELFLLSIE